MRIFTWILAFCILLIAGYYLWVSTGKDYTSLRAEPVPVYVINESTDNGKGNIVGIQPFLTASDYCDQQHFYNALHIYFKKAQAAGLLQARTIVVLPENIGSWLAFGYEKTKVFQSDSMRQAIATVVNANIFNFIQNLLSTPSDDKIKHALIYMKAASMIKTYTAVFSSLAKEFHVTIAAGSIILPQPSLDAKSRIRIQKKRLYYSSFIFDPEGRIQARPVLKVLPEYNSKSMTGTADSNLYVVTQTPAGNLAIVADEENSKGSYYTSLRKIPNIKAVIFLSGTDRIWNITWKGSTGFTIPLSVVKNSEDSSSQGQSWIDYSMSVKIPEAGIHTGIHDQFSGNLWEISYNQNILTLQHDSLLQYQAVKQQGRIVNVWLR